MLLVTLIVGLFCFHSTFAYWLICPQTEQFKQARRYLQPPTANECMSMPGEIEAGAVLNLAMFTDIFDAGMFRISLGAANEIMNNENLEEVLARNVLKVDCFSSQCSLDNNERFIRRQVQLPSSIVSGDYFVYLSLYFDNSVFYSCSKLRIVSKSPKDCTEPVDVQPVSVLDSGACEMFSGYKTEVSKWQYSKHYSLSSSGQSQPFNSCGLSQRDLGTQYFGTCSGDSRRLSPYEDAIGASSDNVNQASVPLFIPRNSDYPLDLQTKLYVADITPPGSSFRVYDYLIELPKYPSTYVSINLTLSFKDWSFVKQMIVPGVKTLKTTSSVNLSIDNLDSPWIIATNTSVSFTVIINDPSTINDMSAIPEYAIINFVAMESFSNIIIRDTLTAETKRITHTFGYMFDVENLKSGSYQLIFNMPCGTIVPQNSSRIIQTGQHVDLRTQVSGNGLRVEIQGYSLCSQSSTSLPSLFSLIRENDGYKVDLNAIYY